MSEELKDCPFCGRDVNMLEDCQTGLYSVACLNNGCSVRPETYGNSTEVDAAIAWNDRHIPEGYSLVKNPSLVEKGQPMPQTLDEWHNLAAGYDKAMLADKAEISRLKSELNNARQQLESLRGKL